jgi:hypothetical protein
MASRAIPLSATSLRPTPTLTSSRGVYVYTWHDPDKQVTYDRTDHTLSPPTIWSTGSTMASCWCGGHLFGQSPVCSERGILHCRAGWPLRDYGCGPIVRVQLARWIELRVSTSQMNHPRQFRGLPGPPILARCWLTFGSSLLALGLLVRHECSPSSQFGDPCPSTADCQCPTNDRTVAPGATMGDCTHTGCLEDPSVYPSGFTCLGLSVFAPGLSSICTPSR